MSENKKVSRHLGAGFAGGLTSAVCLQPLDLIKTRVQQSSSSSIRTVFKDLSSVTQLWRGTLPSALRTSIGSGLYLTSLNSMRSWLAEIKSNTSTNNGVTSLAKSSSTLPKLSAMENLSSGMVARTAVGFLTMPITILKVRFESNMYNYSSLWDASKSIYKMEGITGFFTGFGATAARDAPYAGLYILFYEQLKVLLPYLKPKTDLDLPINININTNPTLFNTSKSAIINSISAASAASLATIVTAPFDTIKTCMQLNPTQYRTFNQTFRSLVSNSGWRRLFDGVSLRLIRKAASAGIAWCIYEELIKL